MSILRVVVRIEAEASALAIERAVAAYAGVDTTDVLIDRTCSGCGLPHGKPRVTTPTGVHESGFVVSKSSVASTVAVAVAQGSRDIGIDLESRVRVSRARVDEVAFSEGERDLIDDEPPSSRLALRARLWSRKEAYLKATGQGVRVDLRSVDLSTGACVKAVFTDIPLEYPQLVLTLVALGTDPVEAVVELVSGGGAEGAC